MVILGAVGGFLAHSEPLQSIYVGVGLTGLGMGLFLLSVKLQQGDGQLENVASTQEPGSGRHRSNTVFSATARLSANFASDLVKRSGEESAVERLLESQEADTKHGGDSGYNG